MRVRVGQQDLRRAAEEVSIVSVVLHPKFLCGRYDNDIALVELGVAVSWRSGVQPSCFPRADSSTANHKEATVAGWGWTHEDYSKGCWFKYLVLLNKLLNKFIIYDNHHSFTRKPCLVGAIPNLRVWYKIKGLILSFNRTQ